MRGIDLAQQLMDVRALLGDVQGTLRTRGERYQRLEDLVAELSERIAAIEERQRGNISEISKLQRAVDRLRQRRLPNENDDDENGQAGRLSPRARVGIITGIGGLVAAIWQWIVPWLQAWFSNKPAPGGGATP